MIQCPNCGSVVADGTRFCGKCGSQIPAASTSAAAPAAETVVAPASMGASAKKSFDFKKLLIPGGIVLLALLLVLLIPKLFAGGGSASLKKDNVQVFQADSDQWLGISKSGKAVLEEGLGNLNGTTQSADGSCALALTSDDTLYLFDGKKFTKVADEVDSYILSFDGKTIAYLDNDDALYVYKNGKSQEVSEDVYSLTALSPDGKAVGYIKYKDDTRRGYYWDGKEHDLGKNILPRAFSKGGRLVYYTNADDKLYVQSGENSESKTRLLESISDYYLNQDGTQFIGYDGTKTYFSENGRERTDVGKGQFRPLTAMSGVKDSIYIGWSSFKNNLYTQSNAVYKLNGKLEMDKIVSSTEDLLLLNDGKTISYIRNYKLYICNTAAGTPAPKQLASDVYDYIPSRNGKLFLYETRDDETFTVTSGGKSQKILDDTVKDWAWGGDSGFVFLLDEVLYFTSGGKGTKVSGVKGDVNELKATTEYVLIAADDREVVYISVNGKSATKIWEEE